MKRVIILFENITKNLIIDPNKKYCLYYKGCFCPPHVGHFDNIRRYIENNSNVKIIVNQLASFSRHHVHKDISVNIMKTYIKELLPKIAYVLKIAVANKNDYLEPFDFNSFVKCIQMQTLIVAYLSMNPQKIITLGNSEIPGDILLPNVTELLIKNTIKLTSIYVDFHIIKILNENESSKPISIFVGMNHAMRLAEILNLKILNNIKDFPIDLSGWEPMGDPETEAEILSQLKKNSFGKMNEDLKYLLKLK